MVQSLILSNEKRSQSKKKEMKSIENVSFQDRVMGAGPTPRLSKVKPKEVAEALDRCWPNCYEAARQLGVDPSLMSYHKKNSPWYQRIFKTIEEKHNGAVEAVLYRKAVSGEDYTFNDRCFYLKAHMPELYNPAKVIKLEDSRASHGEALARAKLAESVVDAEIVENYKQRKQKRRLEIGGGGVKP